MATTNTGMPYPVGTDFVVDGDNAIRALAEAVHPTAPNVGDFTANMAGSANVPLTNNVYTDLVTLVAAAAPAGRYLILAGINGFMNSGAAAAFLRIIVNGVNLADTRSDLSTNGVSVLHSNLVTVPNAGQLTIKTQMLVQATGGNANPSGTYIRAIQL